MYRKIFGRSQAQGTENSTEVMSDSFVSSLHRLRPDIEVNDLISILLDSEKYLLHNPDVKAAGLCAVEHYYKYGYNEGRQFFDPSFRGVKLKTVNNSTKTIIHSTFPLNAGTYLYRGVFPYEKKNEYIWNDVTKSFPETIENIFRAKKIIFIRPNNTSAMKYILKLCKALEVSITYDIDDLMMPEFTRYQGSVRSFTETQNVLSERLNLDAAIILMADNLILSTPSLFDIYKKTGITCELMRNRLPSHFFKDEDVIKCRSTQKIKFLYLSGTLTHLKDYSILCGSLLKLAQKHRDRFEITFLGNVSNHTGIFKLLNVKSNFIEKCNFEKMLDVISEHDVVLVPLEKNIFNDCKSNIKFIEAASQGVPVVCSPASEFCQTITHGTNGWICDNDEQWFSLLEMLIIDPSKTKTVGYNAYQTAIRKYSL